MNQPAQSKSARAFRLMSMTASVASKYAGTKVGNVFRNARARASAESAFERAAGERISQTLGTLKGAAMKLGQMASTNAELLPGELARALAALQQDAPPMDFDTVQTQFSAEMERDIGDCFADFDPQALASASMGQVHRATTFDGRDVAVKVQYPGMRATVDSDIAQVELAMRMAAMAVPRAALDDICAELRTRLLEELDYRHEATAMEQAAQCYRDCDWLVIPGVVPELSCERVLTMQYLPGLSLARLAPPEAAEQQDETLASESASASASASASGAVDFDDYTQAQRDRLGARLLEFVLEGFFVHGQLHGDPNPANFAVDRDERLIVYDFGLVRHYEADFRRTIADMLRAIRDRNPEALDGSLVDAGIRRPDRAAPPTEVYAPWIDMFAPSLTDAGAHEFAHGMDMDAIWTHVPKMLRHGLAFQPTAEIGVLKRVWTGQADNITNLRARVDTAEIFSRYLAVP